MASAFWPNASASVGCPASRRVWHIWTDIWRSRLWPSRVLARPSASRSVARGRVAEVAEEPLEVCEQKEGAFQIEAKIDGLLLPLAGLGQMPERRQRLLEAAHRRPVGRARLCSDASLMEIGNRLLPCLALKRVMAQTLDLFGQALGIERLDRVDDLGVEQTPPVVEHVPVGDIVGERMLEGVLDIRKEAGLVEELGRLQVGEPPANALLGHVRDGLEQRQRYVLPDDGGGLKQA